MNELAKPKLSICIPTLNRARFIGETLESIVSQATPAVEIVIVDGGSTDNTGEVVAHFVRRFAGVRYFRKEHQDPASNSTTPSGAGFDRDCNLAVELAAGEYCWLFTDDDLLKPGAVETVLAATHGDYAVMVANAEVRSSDLSESLEAARLQLTSDRVYSPEENQKFFADVAEYLSFVGGVIVKRQLWLARDKAPYIGTGFIHLGVLFQSPLSQPCLVMAEPLVAIRYGDAHYMRSSRYFEIWMFIFPELIWSFDHLPEAAKRVVCRNQPWLRARTLLQLRAKGAYSAKIYRDCLQARLTSRWQRFVARFMASFPGRLANFLAVVRFHMSGCRAGQVLVDYVKSPFYFAGAFRSSTPSSQTGNLSRAVPVSEKTS
jgi:abequosyltransferase